MLKQDFETKRERTNKLIIDAIFFLILIVVVICIYSENVNADDSADVETYISTFLKNTPARRAKALKLAPVVIAESRAMEFDPLLVAVLISLESSWKTDATGGIGEIGLMQVLPGGVCAKGQDLTTAHGQIKAGVNCLKLSRDACGDDLTRILTMYASGKCVSKSNRTKRLVEKRIRIYRRSKANGKKENQ